MTRKADISAPPRLAYTVEEAAAACSISTKTFLDLVASGHMPKGRVVPGTTRIVYLVCEVGAALRALPARGEEIPCTPDPWGDYQ